MQEDLHKEAVETVEAIKTELSAPWWLKVAATDNAILLMQKPAEWATDLLGLTGTHPCALYAELPADVA